MGKHRLEGGRPPKAALRQPRSTVRPGAHRRDPGHSNRTRVTAGLVTVGAFAAVGVPLTADAHSDQVESAAHQQDLEAAAHESQMNQLAAEARNRALNESRELEKSRAMEQERLARAEAERTAKESAERKAREAAERAVAQRRAAQARAAEQKAAEQKAAEQRASEGQASGSTRASGYVKPAEGSFTSGFGARWGSSHNGIDIANSIGTPIRSVTAGKVIDAGPASGFGQWVRVQHADGTVTVYGHVNTLDVSQGQQVQAGQQIATIGNRGQSTGPHLHFEVIEGGQKIDPLPWLRERGITVQ